MGRYVCGIVYRFFEKLIRLAMHGILLYFTAI